MWVHPTMMEYMIKERRNDILRYAERQRQIESLKGDPVFRPGAIKKNCLRFTRQILSFGKKLMKRRWTMQKLKNA